MNTPPRLLQIFNEYLEKGGEESSVNRIFEMLGGIYPTERCTFSSRDWMGADAPAVWKQAAWMFYNPGAIRQLRAVQERHHADLWLVHNVFPVGSAAVYREAKRLRVPILYYVHNFRPFSVNGYLWAGDSLAPGGLRRRFGKEIAAGAWQNSRIKTAWFAFVLHAMHRLGWFEAVTAWVAISEFMRQRFIEAGVPAERIFTVPHFWCAMESPPPPRDDGYFLFLGRLITAKGIRVLFDAWTLVEQALGDRAPRLIIGGAGPMEAEVRQRCASQPLVKFVGHIGGRAKAELIADCSAMVAPSLWWEPLGLVTYEAYDFGKPMLAAASGGLTETVIDGETGLLHQPGSASELAAQVIELHRDPARRAAMGARGREWLLANANEELWLSRFSTAVAYALDVK